MTIPEACDLRGNICRKEHFVMRTLAKQSGWVWGCGRPRGAVQPGAPRPTLRRRQSPAAGGLSHSSRLQKASGGQASAQGSSRLLQGRGPHSSRGPKLTSRPGTLGSPGGEQQPGNPAATKAGSASAARAPSPSKSFPVPSRTPEGAASRGPPRSGSRQGGPVLCAQAASETRRSFQFQCSPLVLAAQQETAVVTLGMQGFAAIVIWSRGAEDETRTGAQVTT